ncbi:hypothetical protein HELRODRAFT_159528 [Helobdella robusta]|uniref:Uncharacterized protein n=1 Tax=Helobdella robusta TaxID=6412 RepID=T1EP49_HELRO|nr:hypothetical protein HELRODRAFT_159528 [Helobdella robusta]ESO12938.1 hypothetical protein HELRODRAFT_159528 [Helobdella robusta]
MVLLLLLMMMMIMVMQQHQQQHQQQQLHPQQDGQNFQFQIQRHLLSRKHSSTLPLYHSVAGNTNYHQQQFFEQNSNNFHRLYSKLNNKEPFKNMNDNNLNYWTVKPHNKHQQFANKFNNRTSSFGTLYNDINNNNNDEDDHSNFNNFCYSNKPKNYNNCPSIFEMFDETYENELFNQENNDDDEDNFDANDNLLDIKLNNNYNINNGINSSNNINNNIDDNINILTILAPAYQSIPKPQPQKTPTSPQHEFILPPPPLSDAPALQTLLSPNRQQHLQHFQPRLQQYLFQQQQKQQQQQQQHQQNAFQQTTSSTLMNALQRRSSTSSQNECHFISGRDSPTSGLRCRGDDDHHGADASDLLAADLVNDDDV